MTRSASRPSTGDGSSSSPMSGVAELNTATASGPAQGRRTRNDVPVMTTEGPEPSAEFIAQMHEAQRAEQEKAKRGRVPPPAPAPAPAPAAVRSRAPVVPVPAFVNRRNIPQGQPPMQNVHRAPQAPMIQQPQPPPPPQEQGLGFYDTSYMNAGSNGLTGGGAIFHSQGALGTTPGPSFGYGGYPPATPPGYNRGGQLGSAQSRRRLPPTREPDDHSNNSYGQVGFNPFESLRPAGMNQPPIDRSFAQPGPSSRPVPTPRVEVGMDGVQHTYLPSHTRNFDYQPPVQQNQQPLPYSYNDYGNSQLGFGTNATMFPPQQNTYASGQVGLAREPYVPPIYGANAPRQIYQPPSGPATRLPLPEAADDDDDDETYDPSLAGDVDVMSIDRSSTSGPPQRKTRIQRRHTGMNGKIAKKTRTRDKKNRSQWGQWVHDRPEQLPYEGSTSTSSNRIRMSRHNMDIQLHPTDLKVAKPGADSSEVRDLTRRIRKLVERARNPKSDNDFDFRVKWRKAEHELEQRNAYNREDARKYRDEGKCCHKSMIRSMLISP